MWSMPLLHNHEKLLNRMLESVGALDICVAKDCGRTACEPTQRFCRPSCLLFESCGERDSFSTIAGNSLVAGVGFEPT